MAADTNGQTTTVILLGVTPPQHFLYDRFFIDELSLRGITFEIWHLRGIFPDIPPRPTDVPCRRLDGMAELDAALASHPAKLVFLLLNVANEAPSILRCLRRHGKTVAYFSYGVLPAVAPAALARGPLALVRAVVRRVLRGARRLFHGSQFDIVCYAGAGARTHGCTGRIYVPLNLPDWETAQRLSPAALSASDHPYVVFLDCALPANPDDVLLGLRSIDPVRYAELMTLFFQEVEKQYGYEVVIAAHHSARYPDGYFGHRKIEQGKTAELVRGAAAVLCHFSTSLSYAVIFRKPVLFLHCRELRDPAYGTAIWPTMQGMARDLGMPLIDLDAPIARIDWPMVDEQSYSRYTHDYITARVDGRGNPIILTDLVMGKTYT